MNRTSSGIAGVLDNMKNHIAVLDQGKSPSLYTKETVWSIMYLLSLGIREEIKADKMGKKEYERELFKLETRKEELLTRVQENEEFAKGFERDIGPFEQKWVVLC